MLESRTVITLPFPVSAEELARWCDRQVTGILLLSNTGNTGADDEHSRFEWMAGIGSIAKFEPETGSDPFDALFAFHQKQKDWLFGHFGYGLKELMVKSVSRLEDPLGFPNVSFFQPRYILLKKAGAIELHYFKESEEDDFIERLEKEIKAKTGHPRISDTDISLNQRTSRKAYLEKANNVLRHIQRGDIYEANLCMEFHSQDTVIDPVRTFLSLNRLSPMPNAVFYKAGKRYLLCASPERFLQKQGNRIISQPIKGTIRRGKDHAEDEQLKRHLQGSQKERSENVMITDLVRNDLSRTAVRGSVRVLELFGLKSYRRIHQLVTTVAAEIDPKLPWTEVIRHAFPMGSMTGAPKLRAMEIIEEQESVARGLYSGSVGYITPEGDFDLNVVIRSLQYNSADRYLSAMTGSALTAGSNPEEEYEECLLKAETMKNALTN
ncbi:MAG: hypothetical protein RL021_79 [Bacteroidota bacterium]